MPLAGGRRGRPGPARRRGTAVAPVALAMLTAVAAFGLAWPLPAAASGDDHQRAREAVLAGEVMPLPRLLERLRGEHPGQVLDLELERDDGRWVYEIRLLQPGGQLVRLEVDARTGEVLSRRLKGHRSGGGDGR